MEEQLLKEVSNAPSAAERAEARTPRFTMRIIEGTHAAADKISVGRIKLNAYSGPGAIAMSRDGRKSWALESQKIEATLIGDNSVEFVSSGATWIVARRKLTSVYEDYLYSRDIVDATQLSATATTLMAEIKKERARVDKLQRLLDLVLKALPAPKRAMVEAEIADIHRNELPF